MATTNGTPPTGHDWGERTKQSCRGYRAPGHWKTDAYEIRQRFGIPRLDIEAFTDYHEKAIVYPDLLVHEKTRERTKSVGGTDCLVQGDRDSGKTTILLNIAQRLMEENGERVVWRGSKKRSGWLPYKHWTTLYLPKHAEIDAQWMAVQSDDADGLDSPTESVDDLEEIVRDVVYYEDVFDLNEKIAAGPPGTFNVVYPDPSFSGCEEATRQSDRITGSVEFVPEPVAEKKDREATLLDYWWYAFYLARADSGPFVYLTVLFDEAGDISKNNAKQDEHRTYDLVDAVRSVISDSRRTLFTLVNVIHHEENIHPKIRREHKWRIHMPDGSPNPVKDVRSTWPLGIGNILMYDDIMSHEEIGTALCYSKKGFAKFRWDDIQPAEEDADRQLKIDTRAPADLPTEDTEESEEPDVELEYDEQVLKEWQNSTHHRLYVRDPGSGWVSVDSGEVGVDLESPVEGLEFVSELRDQGDHWEVLMTDDDREIVVARIPITSADDVGGSNGVGIGA